MPLKGEKSSAGNQHDGAGGFPLASNLDWSDFYIVAFLYLLRIVHYPISKEAHGSCRAEHKYHVHILPTSYLYRWEKAWATWRKASQEQGSQDFKGVNR